MLDFIPANVRKRIYDFLMGINILLGPILGILVIAGVVDNADQERFLGIAASIMSAAGFLLARKHVNTTTNETITTDTIETVSMHVESSDSTGAKIDGESSSN